MNKPFSLLVAAGLFALPTGSFAVPIQLHAKTWTEVGRVMKSTDTLLTNYNGNWQQSMGMQINGTAQLGENLEGGFGFGLSQVYYSLGGLSSEQLNIWKFINYVSDARVTYTLGEKAKPLFSATFGDFSFNYDHNVKNLGLYLFRGPVYPGILVSGFKELHTDTSRASFLGVHLRNSFGNFDHDLILSSERDLPPSFDWSLGYIAQYTAFGALQIGAGVNFYHLLPENTKITSPNTATVPSIFSKDSSLISSGVPYNPYELQYMQVLGPGDTVFYSHKGIKVMGDFSLDIKRLLGITEPFGEKDMILYGEGAIIGTKNYGTIYSKMSERMPLMIGFNFPTFGFLDFLSLEVERYTAKYRQDYRKLGYEQSLNYKNFAHTPIFADKSPSAIPISLKDIAGRRYQILPSGDFLEVQTGDTIQIKGTALDPENATADDWKWSVNAEKTIAHHIQFSGQIANDHYVPRPIRTGVIAEDGGLSQILTSMKDWYFMFRVGYFF